MDQTSTQTIATFTGTLLRRERHPARHLVQLVFREDGQNWICLSTNLANARLDIGKNYRIQGVFKKMGERAVIQEPTISVVKQRSIAAVVGLIAGGMIVLAGATAAALSVIQSDGPVPTSSVVAPSVKTTPASPPKQTTASPVAVPSTSTSPVPAAPPATPKKKSTAPVTAKPPIAVSNSVSPVVTPATVPEPVAESITPPADPAPAVPIPPETGEVL